MKTTRTMTFERLKKACLNCIGGVCQLQVDILLKTGKINNDNYQPPCCEEKCPIWQKAEKSS